MEGFIYFFALIPSLGISFALRALIRWLTASWQSDKALSWQNVIGAALRALPWALAFSPAMVMKGGGVLIPGSLYLITVGYGMVFGGNVLDTEDKWNVRAALTLIAIIWGLLALVFFVRQCAAIARRPANESKT
jgi:hypothetical protein